MACDLFMLGTQLNFRKYFQNRVGCDFHSFYSCSNDPIYSCSTRDREKVFLSIHNMTIAFSTLLRASTVTIDIASFHSFVARLTLHSRILFNFAVVVLLTPNGKNELDDYASRMANEVKMES